MAELTYREAVAYGIAQEMRRDPNLVMLGEDVAAAGGVFKTTVGLLEEFGPVRVRDTPISEQAIIGAAMGAAMTGIPVIAEIMFSDFLAVCWDMIANEIAKSRYMTNGQVSFPLVIRTANGGGARFGAQHSQSVENWAMMIPGLKVVAPSTPQDVVGLLAASIRDPDPVLFFEHKSLMSTKAVVPDGEIIDELGTARVLKSGTHATVAALALMVPRALEAAERLEQAGVSVEVIDMRSLVPLDTQTLLESVSKTGRLFTVEENPRLCGWGAELVSIVSEEVFWDLDGPSIRITTPHIPLPSAASLEDLALPSVTRIYETILKSVDGPGKGGVMARTLIRGGCVLTMGRTNYAEADVLIDGDTIAEVGPDLRAGEAQVVDATNTIVMPGFVDAHRHAWQSLLRNSGEVGAKADVAQMPLTPDDVYAATLISLLAGASAGITTLVDCTPFTDTERLDAVLRAHTDAGLRSVVVVRSDANANLSRLAGAAGGLLSIAAKPPDPRDGSANGAANDWKAARDLGLRIHTHLGADAPRGLAAGLAEGGLLGSDVTLVHGSNLDPADVAAIASSGASVALTPAADMARGASSLPLQALIDAGVRPGLGVDTEHLSPGDIFAQLRAVISLQHATVFDRKLAGKASLPKLLNTRDVIRYSTADGAAAIGLGDRTGMIEPGHQADIIVLRTDRANIHPINDAIGAVVWGMDTSNVDWVFVAGRVVKRSGEMSADVAGARTLALDAHRRVMGAKVGAR